MGEGYLGRGDVRGRLIIGVLVWVIGHVREAVIPHAERSGKIHLCTI